jgi:NTP pyrophosphatase (non-canonical NTP hydrolase)
MSSIIDFQSYQQLAMRTARFPDDGHEKFHLTHASIGLAGEVGELSDTVKKFVFYNQPLDKYNVAEELGDILWYLSLAASAIGRDLGDIAHENIQKLKTRYPDKYTDEHAAARLDKE